MSKATQAFIVDSKVTSVSYNPASLQTLSGNSETVEVLGTVVRVDAGGSGRTGTILQAGREAGQLCIVLNEGGETVDMATEATSNIKGASGSTGWQPGLSYMYVYDVTNSLWSPVGQALS